jgi:Patatin-like phospholipase
VLADVDGLVDAVLNQQRWRDAKGEGNLIVDGLRHAEVRHALVQKIKPNVLKHVYITIDEDSRQQRVRDKSKVEPRVFDSIRSGHHRSPDTSDSARVQRCRGEREAAAPNCRKGNRVAAWSRYASIGCCGVIAQDAVVMKAFGVFEGGGAKGYAHVGALQAIEARGIELEAVAGSSIGAVIALLIAAGYRRCSFAVQMPCRLFYSASHIS